MRVALLLLLAPMMAWADVYMHNPRGSNDRGCERNDNRNNGNRLFDSQNNDKGGYACPKAFPFDCYKYEYNRTKREECNNIYGDKDYDDISELNMMDEEGVLHPEGVRTPKMYFYEGSVLQIEWTAQHGCGENARTHCDIILQYACEDTLTDDCGEQDSLKRCGPRDGYPITNNENNRGNVNYQNFINRNNDNINRRSRDFEATERIPFSTDYNVQSDLRFGRHETFSFYLKCRTTERNKGLWKADQNINGIQDQTKTRQNPNGNRNGLECPEESEYYPWWHSSPWKDIAILTDRYVEACQWMTEESQNVKPKWECICDSCLQNFLNEGPRNEYLTANNEAGCKQQGGVWTRREPHDIPAPVCGPAPTSRENHLGNPIGGGKSASSYNWTLPYFLRSESQTCVLRLRYNITTGDPSSQGKVTITGTSALNDGNSPLADRNNREAAAYEHFQELGRVTHPAARLGLAVNTNQFGRTFQDRSWSFEIRKRPAGLSCLNNIIYNLNVRGKRGNIVQAYPNVEYDFAPSEMYVTDADCIHIQWTGSDYNPARNANNAYGGPPDPTNFDAGRTDRHNMVQIKQGNFYARPLDYLSQTNFIKATWDQKVRLAWLDQDIYDNQTCWNITKMRDMRNDDNLLDNVNDRDRHWKNCGKLSAQKTPYFDAGLYAPGPLGTYYFMSTRDNSFSNRNMQGILHVQSVVLSNGNVFFVVIGAAVGSGLMMAGLCMCHRRANRFKDADDEEARQGFLVPIVSKKTANDSLAPPPPVPRRTRPGVEGMASAAAGGGVVSSTGGSTTKVTAKHNHEPSEQGELKFRKGDIITVLRKDPSGWWEGRTPDGQQGIFPSNYVQ